MSTDLESPLLDSRVLDAIVDAIGEAELTTSAEIRVHLEEGNPEDDEFDRAAMIFAELDMHKTEARNGVLFYIAYNFRKIVILGDVAINMHVPEHFWENIIAEVVAEFKLGNYELGLQKGIADVGKILAQHFPYHDQDRNELSNEVSIGNKGRR